MCALEAQPWALPTHLSSRSALFIETKNHVRACPLLKLPWIHFIFVKIKPYTYKYHCFKIHFHTCTRVQKQIQNVYVTCVQMSKMQKYGPIICLISNHGFLVIKSSWTSKPVLYICFSIALSPASCISTSCLIAICLSYVHFVRACSK